MIPSGSRLKLRSTIGRAPPFVPSSNASSRRTSASAISAARIVPPPAPKPGISTCGSSPGTTMFVLNAP
jgi:hypothetical protein